ncbi:MAG: YeeE/YedE family protein [Myxococcales bacterium]|nr:YeeE/YedE family protein [Myxococcales bacterium]
MGPLVPDTISSELSLVFGFFIGIAFGFILEQAGFSSSRKLTGLFYGTDFTVLRVFFTAGVTAMSGILLLSQFGWLDMEIIFVNPTYLYPGLLGGGIMGVGFVVGGYCPGTSFCGAAIGKIDGMVFILGATVGIAIFAELFPWLVSFYLSGSYGDLTVETIFGITKGQFALFLIVTAIVAFVITTLIEQWINPKAPSRSFPKIPLAIAAIATVGLGVFLTRLPDYKTSMLAKATTPQVQKAQDIYLMSPDELAFRILDGDPNLQTIDVRSSRAFAKRSLPKAINMPPGDIFGKTGVAVLSPSRKQKVFFAQQESEARRAATLAALLGYENLAILQGGLDQLYAEVLSAQIPTNLYGRHQQDTYTFRLWAGAKLLGLIKARNAPKESLRKVKKIQGGCGI